MPLALWIFLAVAVHPTPSHGCNCAFMSYDGWVAEKSPKRLPSNAKGALFHATPAYLGKKKVAWDQAFEVTDKTTGKIVPVRIRKLRLSLPEPEGQEEQYRPLTFRVEPEGGLTAGHEYRFGFSANLKGEPGGRSQPYATVLDVIVGSEPLAHPAAGAVSLRPEAPLRTEMIAVPAGGACSSNILARVQGLRLVTQKALEPYGDSILFFTAFRDETTKRTQPWFYRRSACSNVRWGRSDLAVGQDAIFASCAKETWGRREIELDRPYAIIAFWGFLELEDDVVATNELQLSFDATQGQCDRSAYLDSVFSGKDPKALTEELCKMGRGEVPYTPEVLTGLVSHATDGSLENRRCVHTALASAPYRLQNATDEPTLKLVQEKVIPAAALGIGDSDEAVRVSAADAFRNLARIWGKKLRFESVLSQVVKGLKDGKHDVRIATAEAMQHIGPAAASTTSALLDALADKARPNYAAPYALVAVDPANRKVVPALISALEHPDGIVQGTAAKALGQVGRGHPEAVKALLGKAERESPDAIEALGEIGEESRQAAPLLLRVAGTSESGHVRHAAMKSLVAIGAERPRVVKIVTTNVEAPVGEYGRQQAIECLGLLGSDARSTIPSLAAVLAKKPTEYELGTIVRALRSIGPTPKEAVPLLEKIRGLTKSWPAQEAERYLNELKAGR